MFYINDEFLIKINNQNLKKSSFQHICTYNTAIEHNFCSHLSFNSLTNISSYKNLLTSHTYRKHENRITVHITENHSKIFIFCHYPVNWTFGLLLFCFMFWTFLCVIFVCLNIKWPNFFASVFRTCTIVHRRTKHKIFPLVFQFI